MRQDATKKAIGSDWKRLAAMTDEEAHANALADPDAQPLTEDQLANARRISPAKSMRRALGLTQEQFAERYRIPLGTLRDWEQHRSEPDAPARAYLMAIRAAPDVIADALSRGGASANTTGGEEGKQ
jgi:putative transcriptional regulator